MDAARYVAAMLILALLGCNPDPGEGPFALAFDGGEDCVVAELDGVETPAALTIELWMRGTPDDDARSRPYAEWKGLFSLADSSGDTVFSVGDSEGASLAETLMDGVLHHVAGTWDGAEASLWVDGQRKAFSDAGTLNATSTLRIGCNAAVDAYDGLLDEVRLSSTARYTETFERPSEPFAVEDDTIVLFHFDEGTGEETLDSASGIVAGAYGVEWVPFRIGTEG